MSEFIEIGEIAKMFNTIKSADVVQNIPAMAKPSTMKKSNNSGIIFLAVVIVGVSAYLLYKKKKEKESNKI
jgi:LPXTG-motif cell wall-anchored protein